MIVAFHHILLSLACTWGASLYGEAEISDGTPITVEEKGFTITPPTGWEVHQSDGRTGLLIQKPLEKGMTYQPNIRVMTFQEPQYIDDYTAEQFEEVLIERFSKSSSSISQYVVRNNQMVNMGDGRDAILYYTQFLFNKTELMQAHLLISGSEKHYLISYTDLATSFEDESETSSLQTAWSTITSTTTSTLGPVRFQSPRSMLITVLVFMGALSVIWYFRRRKAIQKYQSWGKKVENDDLDMEADSDIDFDSELTSEIGSDMDSDISPEIDSDIDLDSGIKSDPDNDTPISQVEEHSIHESLPSSIDEFEKDDADSSIEQPQWSFSGHDATQVRPSPESSESELGDDFEIDEDEDEERSQHDGWNLK